MADDRWVLALDRTATHDGWMDDIYDKVGWILLVTALVAYGVRSGNEMGSTVGVKVRPPLASSS